MATRKSYKEAGVEEFLWNEFNVIRSSGSFDMNSASSWLAVLYCKARKASVKLHTQEKGLCFLTIDAILQKSKIPLLTNKRENMQTTFLFERVGEYKYFFVSIPIPLMTTAFSLKIIPLSINSLSSS